MSAPEDFIPAPRTFKYTFPPFPVPDPDVKIIPFAEYRERGISMEPGPDGIEVDVLGVPTVALPRSHEADECKTKTRRKTMADERVAKKEKALGTTRPWYEQWEDSEYNRFAPGVNPHDLPSERLRTAARYFADDRTWPLTFASESGPKYIWDKFERFAGLSEGVNPPGSKRRKKAISKPDSDSDDEVMDDIPDGPSEHVEDDAEETQAPIYLEKDMKQVLQASKWSNQHDKRVEDFLDDPERQTKIFLSSYARQEGYIFAEANLECLPRVLRFFFQFLIRCRVVAELEPNLKKCIAVTDAALQELPKTASMSRTLPGIFASACNAAFGTEDTGHSFTATAASDGAHDSDFPAVDNSAEKETPQKLETPESVGWGQGTAVSFKDHKNEWGQPVQGSWGAGNLETEHTGWGLHGDGNTGDGWDLGNNDRPQEDTPVTTFGWQSLDTENGLPRLFSLFGPTAFPVTHRAGVMERSVRRIMSIIPANPNPPPLPVLPNDCLPSADAVESRLDTSCVKVVLAPIPDWNAAGEFVYERPSILPKSVGPIVDKEKPSKEPNEEGRIPHDPLTQDIAILIMKDDPCLPHLHVGMSLAGEFIQLARVNPVQVEAQKKKKSKSAKKATTHGFWYLANLAFVVPSFWTVAESST